MQLYNDNDIGLDGCQPELDGFQLELNEHQLELDLKN